MYFKIKDSMRGGKRVLDTEFLTDYQTRADFSIKTHLFLFFAESHWVDSVMSALAKILLMSSFTTFITIVVKKIFVVLVLWATLEKKSFYSGKIFFLKCLLKVVKEDISKILGRAEITESTQWLSVKKRKSVFILF